MFLLKLQKEYFAMNEMEIFFEIIALIGQKNISFLKNKLEIMRAVINGKEIQRGGEILIQEKSLYQTVYQAHAESADDFKAILKLFGIILDMKRSEKLNQQEFKSLGNIIISEEIGDIQIIDKSEQGSGVIFINSQPDQHKQLSLKLGCQDNLRNLSDKGIYVFDINDIEERDIYSFDPYEKDKLISCQRSLAKALIEAVNKRDFYWQDFAGQKGYLVPVPSLSLIEVTQIFGDKFKSGDNYDWYKTCSFAQNKAECGVIFGFGVPRLFGNYQKQLSILQNWRKETGFEYIKAGNIVDEIWGWILLEKMFGLKVFEKTYLRFKDQANHQGETFNVCAGNFDDSGIHIYKDPENNSTNIDQKKCKIGISRQWKITVK
jgi:hypothetical protein